MGYLGAFGTWRQRKLRKQWSRHFLCVLLAQKLSEATTVTVEENATGMELARMLEESFSLTPGTHLVLFQSGCRNAQKIKVQDGATLTVKLNELECCRDDSSLRQSIKKNGQT